ncbi:6607_t:CDS:2 [Ambispora leptoticha]|uniref:6607_t:CDS:1 n=1 Tax=Ambispora leptoticha TaxID=144679 RepID=A0A9N9D1F2_9GLOM|nr:6607_t:CDS:2 [Ambispora leptoticha]
MTAVLRSNKYMDFKASEIHNINTHFKVVDAGSWQLKHYLSFRLKTMSQFHHGSPFTTIGKTRRILFCKIILKKIPTCITSFCKELLNVCETFEGSAVRENCEKLYNNFYQLNLDKHIEKNIVERIRLLDSTIFSERSYSGFLQATCQRQEASASDENRREEPELNREEGKQEESRQFVGPQTSDSSDLSSKKTIDCQEVNKINDYVEVEENAGDSNGQFVERIEDYKTTSKTCRSWVLRSGTDVGEVLARYVETIPEAQKCLNLAYWNILDLTEDTLIRSLFSANDWEEITESFGRDVILIESDIPDVEIYFFNEVEKEIERLSPEIIEKNNHVELANNEKDIVDNIRRAIITYAENLKGLELPVSESDFDNDFPNMLTKRFLDKEDLKMDVNEGRSIILRARIGQKCDFRGTLKNNVNSLEATIGLRSGGLPVANRRKILEDRIDLSVAMRDVLYDFFKANSNAPGDDLHHTVGSRVLRLGRLSQTKMPNTQKSLAILEGFYALMSDVKATLKAICDHTNKVSLSNSRAHRDRKRKKSVHDKQLGSFGTPSTSPKKSKSGDL